MGTPLDVQDSVPLLQYLGYLSQIHSTIEALSHSDKDTAPSVLPLDY